MNKDMLVSVERCQCGGYFKVKNAYVDENDCGIVETTCEQCGATCPVIVVPELPEDRHE